MFQQLDQYLWDAMLALRIGSSAVEGDQWQPEETVPQINEITRRVNGKLEVKVGDSYVSLMDYFDSAKNGNKTQADLDGRSGTQDNWLGPTARHALQKVAQFGM